MNNLDEIYNQALELLKKGFSKQEVLSKFPQHQEQLAPLLNLSGRLFAMPKSVIPTPLMQRKYAMQPARKLWLTWLHVSKFAGVSMAVMLLISAVTVAGYQAAISTPGKSLFAIKKSAEQLQLILATNQDDKAKLQVDIAQKRLEDAQQVLSDPASDTSAKTDAINELTKQTNTAVAEVNTVAKTNPKANSPLLSSLDKIAKQQQNLLAAVAPGSQIKIAANTALQALTKNTAKISEIKNSIATASNDQALAQLSDNPNSVVVLGEITRLIDNQVTVEKTAFTLTTQTIIKNPAGTILSVHDLSPNQKVNVIGVKNQGSLVAQQIFIIVTDVPQVKGVSTEVTTTTTSATVTSPPVKATDDQSLVNPNPPTDSNVITGTSIFGDPAPQVSN